MKVKVIVLILLCAFIALGANGTIQQKPWKLAKSGKGIEIYTRKTESENLKEFKAMMTVKSSLSEVAALITDIAKYVEWQDNCQQAEVVTRIDEHTVISRFTSETPWPFHDRDIVLRMKRQSETDNRLVYVLNNAPNAYPEQKNFVRIPKAGGRWELSSAGDAQCEVVYQFYADPGGNIPKWLVKMFIVQGPYNSFVRMKEMLEQD